MCWSMCPCDAGGTCVDSAEMGEMCQKSCQSDKDCRQKDGYVCDAMWNACTIAGLAAPRPPVCENPAKKPPRKTFGRVEQLAPSELGRFTVEPTAAITKKGDVITVFAAGGELASDNTLASTVISSKGGVEVATPFKFDTDNHWYPTLSSDRKGKLYLGYLGFNRESQLSIIIRTAIAKAGRAYFNVGAGIVADSVPGAEYDETMAKARGFFAALQVERSRLNRVADGER
jgi:hypothetical protein